MNLDEKSDKFRELMCLSLWNLGQLYEYKLPVGPWQSYALY